MADKNLNGGILTAGGLVVPGLAGPPVAKANERVGTPAATATTLTMTLNTAYATPIFIPDATTLIEIAVKVTTLIASGTVRLGIYNDDGTGNLNPGTVLLDAGTVDASTLGIKPVTINQAVTPGTKWLVAVAQGAAPGVSAIAGGLTQLASSGSDNFLSTTTGYTQTGVTGALGTWAGSRVVASTCPRAFVQHV